MTEFRVEVVKLSDIQLHPNADRLEIANVYGGYPVIVGKGEFKPGDLAVYVPVDSLVPTEHEHFKFLDSGKGRTHERIKAKKLRGVFSMGLLVPAFDGATEGQDVQYLYGVEKYVPPAEQELDKMVGHKLERSAKRNETRSYDRKQYLIAAAFTAVIVSVAYSYSAYWYLALVVSAWAMAFFNIRENRKRNKKPNLPVYDIEGYRKYKGTFVEGELVWISEKIHGANGRYVHTGKKFFVGSRTVFKSEKDNIWWRVAEKYGLEEKLSKFPNLALYGEVYGDVQDLKYGHAQGEVSFAAFDVLDITTREYYDAAKFSQFCKALDIPVVPTLYFGEWKEELTNMAEGKTVLEGGHVREGIVIKPMSEQHVHYLGRKVLKLAGEGYLLRKEQ